MKLLNVHPCKYAEIFFKNYAFEDMNIICGFLNTWEHTVHSLQLAFLHLTVCFSVLLLLLAL